MRSEVYERLRRAIVGGELPDGSALVSTELSAQLGVSRTPVREAIVRLVQDGLAVETDGGQVVVRPVRREELESFFEIRAELERFAAHKATERRTDASLARLRDAERRVADAVAADAPAVRQVELNEEFHRVLYEGSGNALLGRALLDLEAMTARRLLDRLYEHADAERTVVEHRAIVAAIEAGDAAGAGAAAAAHVEQAGRDLLEIFDRERTGERE
jgi:DNA-binding GntR family transcriptional regulator